MNRSAIALPAVLVLLVGLVFTGQGLGYIKGSSMTGSSFWLAVGLVMAVAALATLAWLWRRGGSRAG